MTTIWFSARYIKWLWIPQYLDMFGCLWTDNEDDTLPDSLEDGPVTKSRSIPHSPITMSPSGDGSSKRKRHESALIRMTSILAAVGAGFDIRLSNTVAIHPNLHSGGGEDERNKKRDSFIFNRRDAYLGAVRDSFIEPENDFRSYQYAPSHGYWHTYHVGQTRQRPSLNLEGGPGSTPFYLPGGDQSEEHAQGPFHGFNPRTTSHRSSYADSESSVISSTSTSERTVIYNRQISDSSTYDTPTSSTVTPSRPSQNPQRRSVTFEDDFNPPDHKTSSAGYSSHRHSPINTSNSEALGISDYEARYQHGGDYHRPHPDYPPNIPPRRRAGDSTPQRPTTLDIAARSGPIQLKYPSPSPYSRTTPSTNIPNTSSRMTPTSSAPVDTPNTNHESASYFSTRSHLSPGNTPPHIRHQTTLLDIDMEGQSLDATQPLVLHKPKPSLVDLEREFLH